MGAQLSRDVATNVVGTLVVEYLVNPVVCRVRYLFCHHKIVEEFRKQKENLTKEQTRVQEKVKEAKLQLATLVIDKHVEDWLTEVETIFLNDVKSLEGRIQENKRCFRWCPNWGWRYKLSKEIEKKTVAIAKLIIDSSKFERYGHRAELPNIELSGSEGYLPSKSSIAAFNEIMEALKDDKVNMIGVWGIGGVGKTTLVKKVGNDIENTQREIQLLKRVVFVIVSQSPNIEYIQQKIADFIHLKFEKTTKEARAAELWSRLENDEEMILIILDDMWEKLNLKEIGIPLAENRKGCRIIFTTRRRQVCENMASQAKDSQPMASQVIVPLGVLEENEAWKLFKMKASLDEKKADAETIEVAKEVARECNGLPVAIVTLARALKDTKLVKGWEIALKKLRNRRLLQIGNIEEEDKNAYVCLKMSYDYLTKDTTKKCFLLCALYPEDHSIHVEEMVRHAWGLELYRDADSIDEVRFEVEEAIDYLKDSCLLLEDGKRHVKVHDVVRDVALWIASQEDKGIATKSGDGSENENFNEKLEILLLNYHNSEAPTFQYFEGMPQLKVLSVEIASTWNGSFISLNALKSLRSLRALQLKGFDEQLNDDISALAINDISALANLTKLEILCFRGFTLKESINILGELKNLRVLDLRKCEFFSKFGPNLIQRLVQLEELYLDDSISTVILPELNFLPRLTSLWLELPSPDFPEGFVFPTLERYEIDIGSEHLLYSTGIIPSKSLRISMGLPLYVFQKLLPKVECLVVDSIKKIKEIKCLTDRSPGNVSVATILKNLKCVRILDCENLQVIFQMEKAKNHEVVLSKLKYLSLHELPDLQCIWKMPTQSVSLGSLETITLYKCEKLQFLSSFSLAQSLVHLEKLVVVSCTKLEQIFEDLAGDEQEISPNRNLDKFLCFPKLRHLKIEGCCNLEYIFSNLMVPEGLPQLQKLRLYSLPRLKQICKPARERVANEIQLPQHKILLPLMCLEVNHCREFSCAMVHFKPVQAYLEGIEFSTLKVEIRFSNTEELFQIDELKENQPRALSNLVHLELDELPELRWIWKGPAHYFSLQSLKDVNITRCEKLDSLFSPSLVQSLQQLERLQVKSCEELKNLFEGLERDGETESNGHLHPMCLPRLKTMYIYECARLECVLPITLTQGLPHLESLYVHDCPPVSQVFGAAKEHDDVEHFINLPHLNNLSLRDLRILRSFGPENCSVKVPALGIL